MRARGAGTAGEWRGIGEGKRAERWPRRWAGDSARDGAGRDGARESAVGERRGGGAAQLCSIRVYAAKERMGARGREIRRKLVFRRSALEVAQNDLDLVGRLAHDRLHVARDEPV